MRVLRHPSEVLAYSKPHHDAQITALISQRMEQLLADEDTDMEELVHRAPGVGRHAFFFLCVHPPPKGVFMIWLPLLGIPLAAAFTSLGSALTKVTVLTLALQATFGIAVLLLVALIWSLRNR